MIRRGVGLVLLASVWLSASADAPRFFVVGDVPYAEREWAPLAALLATASAQGAPFLIHVGDIKSGSESCADARLARVADLFRRQPVPVIYTPGDNEWTDCQRRAAGGMNPLERLRRLRELFFADASVLHQQALVPRIPAAGYPENRWFVYRQVLFMALHVVGSDNNRGSRQPAAALEFERRAAANRRLLEQALRDAPDARALVLLFHANPRFERWPTAGGFAPLREDLAWLTARHAGPLLLIHGDTHGYRFDRPAIGAAEESTARFWRLEVPGSPFVSGVWVEVDAGADPPFRVTRVEPPAPSALP